MKKKLRIIADQAIPSVSELFSPMAEVVLVNNKAITNDKLKNADALFVRSVTNVNQQLLEGTKVKFVGSMTAGIDHVDTKWLQQNQIEWANAKGANASAVAHYVMSVIAYLQQQHQLPTKPLNVGIIGAGHAGSALEELLSRRGANVVLNDPPRAFEDPEFDSTALTEFSELDLISLHTPLIYDGKHQTHKLINEAFLQNLKKDCVLINTSRGEVVDLNALLRATQIIFCFDVWENEPDINLELLKRAVIATPHIAGYTLEAKHKATFMVYQAACRYFNWQAVADKTILQKSGLKKYNPLIDTQKLKAHPEKFAEFRNNYKLR